MNALKLNTPDGNSITMARSQLVEIRSRRDLGILLILASGELYLASHIAVGSELFDASNAGSLSGPPAHMHLPAGDITAHNCIAAEFELQQDFGA